MLDFHKVSYQYPTENVDIIEELSFHVARGEFASLIGVSGCGKSTIFRLITQLLHPKSGTIDVGGKNIIGQKSYVGYMPQKDLLFPWRTIGQNLELPMELKGLSRTERERRRNEVLEEIGLKGYGNKYPKELSGGMRQRVAFGRTILTDSELMLLDEPFSALDFLTKLEMQEWLLTEWQQLQKTILFITHDIEEAIFLSQTIFVVGHTPIHTLERIQVPLPKMRTRACLNKPEIAALKNDLLEMLRRQVVS
ncbi:ABC transporter ATP-binding protein [Dehalobacterium formicoaceticum]|uniref:ABC transporter ATP-binding protein n=1 Tax=Dehalobacterium formicoaceticum TaxID=51515 RepID=UPI000B7FD36B|nr:ABC transporter ATP-binding protein [Dehalobacterium formicoaceticum]